MPLISGMMDTQASIEVTSSTPGEEDQEVSLLGSQRHHEVNKPRWYHVSDAEVPSDVEPIWCFNSWWKLLVFLIVCTTLLPISVRWLQKDSAALSTLGNTSSEAGVRSEDYVLSMDWSYDAAPLVREYVWTVAEVEYNPDGVYRPMLLVNNQFPGPLLRMNEGDTLRITVINKATNATSIHFHGIFQNGSAWQDGSVGIAQCPIAPGRNYTYEFQVDGQAGTYFWHGHQGVQASDGLFGPLIVHSRDETVLQRLSYASDRVIMVSDHYWDLSGSLTRRYLAPDMENAEPVPDGALINGRSIRDCSTLPTRKCDNTTSNVGRPVFDLKANEKHRLRIVNTGAFAEFQVQIDEHEFAVSEVDGTDVVPQYYHRLNINPAQRYSIIINTNSTLATSFWTVSYTHLTLPTKRIV